MQMILITDALNAMERNIRVFLDIATGKAGTVTATIDIYSGTASINHEVNPATGKIDCKVRFPALPAQYRLSKLEMDRWIGYFVHELCHAIYTDENAWRDACKEHLAAVVNGLEDVRIEREFNRSAVATNSTELLNALLAYCVDEMPKTYDPNSMKDLPWLFAMAGRVMLCGYVIPKADAALARLNPAMRKLVSWVMADLDAAKSTMDVLILARKIQAHVAAQPKPVAPPSIPVNPGKAMDVDGNDSTGGESDESSDGESDESDAGTGPASDWNPDAPDAGNGESSDGESDESSDGESGGTVPGVGDGDGQPGKGSESGLPESDIRQANPVILNPVSKEVQKDSRDIRNHGDAGREASVIASVRVAERTAGQPFRPFTPNGYHSGSPSIGAVDRVAADSLKTGKLKAQVARVLKAEENESWQRGKTAGRLDRFALHKVATGNARDVFCKRTIASGYETEIEILCDGSDSMGTDSKDHVTAVLAWTIASAAQQVGVRCGISRFSDGRPTAIKQPAESFGSGVVRDRIGIIANYTDGSTDLTGAIIFASAKLASRAPNKRKILFVISDGECHSGPAGVIRANAYAKRIGIETVVLCIDTPPHPGFGLAVRCNPKDVANVGLGTLVRALSRD
jgi:Mg-chelatase subunit ChlD